jgi:hypothetical protein
MSRKPSVEHEYHPKKDRLDISIKHYALKKKSKRERVIQQILAGLGSKKLSKGKDKSPLKETRLPEVGD